MSEHVGCGGNLTFHHQKQVKAGNKTITKNMHECDKCGAMINVITFPSYEEYVLRGQIRTTKSEYLRIREEYDRLLERQKERAKNAS